MKIEYERLANKPDLGETQMLIVRKYAPGIQSYTDGQCDAVLYAVAAILRNKQKKESWSRALDKALNCDNWMYLGSKFHDLASRHARNGNWLGKIAFKNLARSIIREPAKD